MTYFDREANDLGYDDGLKGEPMMTRKEFGSPSPGTSGYQSYKDYLHGYEQGADERDRQRPTYKLKRNGGE
jgi:hypothetical protein